MYLDVPHEHDALDPAGRPGLGRRAGLEGRESLLGDTVRITRKSRSETASLTERG